MNNHANAPTPALDAPTAPPFDLAADLRTNFEDVARAAHSLTDRHARLMAELNRIRAEQADAHSDLDGIEKLLGSLPQFRNPAEVAPTSPGAAALNVVGAGRGR